MSLIERLEAASAPDRDIDGAIYCEIDGWVRHWNEKFKAHQYWKNDRWVGLGSIPSYTSSIDAALTLVPEGWHWSLYDTNGADKANAQVEPPEYSFEPMNGEAATPALSLCIAAMKARADITGTGKTGENDTSDAA